MKMHKWTPCEPIGSYVKLMNFNDTPFLQSVPMLANGQPEFGIDVITDVELAAFSEAELPEYCKVVAEVLDATPDEIKAAIRG